MSSARRCVVRSRRLLAGICSSALAVSLFAAPATAPAATPSPPPPTIPVSQIHAGMTGVGSTVIKDDRGAVRTSRSSACCRTTSSSASTSS